MVQTGRPPTAFPSAMPPQALGKSRREGLEEPERKVIEGQQDHAGPRSWAEPTSGTESAGKGRGNELPMIESDWPNLPAMFLHWAARKPDRPFLWVRKDKDWVSLSWAETERRVRL